MQIIYANVKKRKEKNKRKENQRKIEKKNNRKEQCFILMVQLTTFMFLCHTLFCVDINIVIIWMLSWIYFYCYSDAMNTTNLLTTVIILCFLFVFSFLSWYWMEKISMELRWSLLPNKSLYIRSCLNLRLQPYFDNIFRRFCILFSKAFVQW